MESFTEESKTPEVSRGLIMQVPTDIIYQCLLFLEVKDAARLIMSNRTLYHSLYKSSKEGQNYLL